MNKRAFLRSLLTGAVVAAPLMPIAAKPRKLLVKMELDMSSIREKLEPIIDEMLMRAMRAAPLSTSEEFVKYVNREHA